MTRRGWLIRIGGAGVAVAGLFWLVRPRAAAVETAVVRRGPLAEAVRDDGITRVRLRHTVVAPVAGRYLPAGRNEGDTVRRGAPLGSLHPLPLDARARSELEARRDAARATLEGARARWAQARAASAEADRAAERSARVAANAAVSQEELDRVTTTARVRAEEVHAAEHAAQAAAYDVAAPDAALAEAGGVTPLVVVCATGGQVLRVHERAERIVAAGTPLIDVGDLATLEIVVDVLSADAIRVRPGHSAAVWQAPGAAPLAARVRRVEPSGFRKVSPLGVEEQRVNVILDFTAGAADLGDQYRVDARIVVWDSADVLLLPLAALFRVGDAWMTFVVEDGRARRRAVRIGHRGPEDAEVLDGVAAGAVVVLHPGDRIADGARVRP